MPTKIGWADETWNPVTGCTRVSPGCEHCYIDWSPPFRMNDRHFRDRDGSRSNAIGSATGLQLHPDRLGQPLRWTKPKRIFVNSLSDLFHDEIPDEYIAKVFAVMALAHRHTFQVLTKRPARMRSLLNSVDFRGTVGLAMQEIDVDATQALFRDGGPYYDDDGWTRTLWPILNVHLGVTVEDQKHALLRVPILLDTPAAVRFLSAEPLLGAIDLTEVFRTYQPREDASWRGDRLNVSDMLQWVIVGGESGPDARPMHPEWARKIVADCWARDVAVFFKQWGEWAPEVMGVHRDNSPAGFLDVDGTWRPLNGKGMPDAPPYARGDAVTMRRGGKHATGNLLDGHIVEHFPTEVTSAGEPDTEERNVMYLQTAVEPPTRRVER